MAKIRSGFVTNSSSSSFVIMHKQIPELEKDMLEQYPFLKNYMQTIEKSLFDGEKIATLEELNKYVISQWGWRDQTLEEVLNDDEYAKKSYSQYKEKIENGYSITFKIVDNNDESAEEMLRNLHDGVNFIVIDNN